eukprot:TRINITY_DN6517_c0_g2_i1.p1 TRINITY_DN6517_c0_g2~~TRINITY_DN6517_c0_g2_i1.p1  ORF type:complete len:3836 (-),score=923.59 TRINITY_DN6517_c0_g2_i1:17-10561(-)
MDAVLVQIANEVASTRRSAQANRETLKFFIVKFHNVIERKAHDPRRLTVALQGFGTFAAAIARHMSGTQLSEVLSTQLRLAESMFTGAREQMQEAARFIPAFLTSFARIVQHLDAVDETVVAALQRVMSTLFLLYPHEPRSKWRSAVVDAVSRLLMSLHARGVLRTFLSGAFVPGLTLTASSVAVAASVGGVGRAAWEEYIPLWKAILSVKPPADLISLADVTAKDVQRVAHGALVNALLVILERLDLAPLEAAEDSSAQQAHDTSLSVAKDPAVVLARKPKDVEIFSNMEAFLRDLFPLCSPRKLSPHMYVLIRAIISKSVDNPLAAGLYRLLTDILRQCYRSKYFVKEAYANKKSPAKHMDDDDEDAMDVDNAEPVPVETDVVSEDTRDMCTAVTSRFLLDVATRLPQYKGELLRACAELVLAAPSELVPVAKLARPMAIALTLGLSFPQLASVALDALEHWMRHQNDEVNNVLPNVLPLLADYIRDSGDAAVAQDVAQEKKKNAASVQQRAASEVLQQRVLRLLGTLPGDALYHVIGQSEDRPERASVNPVKWNRESCVKFTVPFRDLKPDVYLDPLLPRVLELAESAGDRKTRVAACELLHAATIITIARSHGSSTGVADSAYSSVFQHIFPPLLRLAADSDDVVRALFAPLAMQILRWLAAKFSHPKDIGMMLDVIATMVATQEAATREFAAKCLTEFLIWARRSTSQEAAQDKRSTRPLMDRLLGLARHPSPYQRLGAAVAFNSSYRVFREDESLCNRFLMELTSSLIKALRLADSDDPAIGTVAVLKQAVQHAQRVFTKRAEILLKVNPERVEFTHLADFALWLFRQLAVPEEAARVTIMQLFSAVLPLVAGSTTTKDWISSVYGDNIVNAEDLAAFPSVIAHGAVWLRQLSASLHAACYLVAECGADPKRILSKSPIWSAIPRFIDHYSALATSHASLQLLTPLDLSQLLRAKCEVTTGVLRVVDLTSRSSVDLPKNLLGAPFVDLALVTALEPWAIGFDVHDTTVARELPKLAALVCGLLTGKLSKVCASLQPALKSLANKYGGVVALVQGEGKLDVSQALYVLAAHKELLRVNLLVEATGTDKATLAQRLAHSAVEGALRADTAPERHQVLRAGLDLALACGWPLHDVIHHLSDDGCRKGSTEPSGAIFARILGEPVLDFIVKFIKQAARDLITAATTNIRVMMLLRDGATRATGGPQAKSYADEVLKELPRLLGLADTGAYEQRRCLLELISAVMKCSPTASSNPSFLFVRDVLVKFIVAATNAKVEDREINAALTIQALSLLPILLQLSAEHVDPVIRAVQAVAAHCFPLDSKELVEHSARHTLYISVLDRLLEALPVASSPLLLPVLFPVLREKEHTHGIAIAAGLTRFVKEMKPDHAPATLKLCVETMLDPQQQTAVRIAVGERIAVPLLHAIPSEGTLGATLMPVLGDVLSVLKAISPSVRASGSQLVDRIAAFAVLEALYRRISAPAIRDTYNAAYYTGAAGTAKGNELNVFVMKCASSTHNEAYALDIELDLVRRYHCAAYNALAAVIVRTQTKVDFFVQFLFDARGHGGLWDRIVDQSAKFEFPVEAAQSNAADVAAILRNIRDRPTGSSQDIRYMSSLYLADSSLAVASLPIAQLGAAPGGPDLLAGPASGGSFGTLLDGAAGDGASGLVNTLQDRALDSDVLNNHPCMLTVLNAITSVKSQFGSVDMAKVSAELLAKFGGDSTLNVKLFIGRILINRAADFEPFASQWWEHVVNLILQSDRYGDGWHLYLRELCVLLLEWKTALPPDTTNGKRLAGAMIAHLMGRSMYNRPSIVRQNVEIVKLFVERWKGRIDVQRQPAVTLLDGDITRVLGVQLLGILVANDFPAYDGTDLHSDEQTLYMKIADNLNHSSKPVYEATARLIGMILRRGCEALNTLARARLTSMFEKGMNDRFVTCLAHLCDISTGSPAFATVFANRVAALIPGLPGDFRWRGLQVMSSRAVTSLAMDASELFARLKPQLIQFLSLRDERTQEEVLRFLQHLMPKIDEDEKTRAIIDLLVAAGHGLVGATTRELYFSNLGWLYDNRPLLREHNPDLRGFLLRALADETEAIRTQAVNFWAGAGRLQADPVERLLQIISPEMYAPAAEPVWLGAAISLLLQLCESSVDYQRQMFEPLDPTVHFRPLNMDSVAATGIAATVENMPTGMIRATQTPMFSMTQSQAMGPAGPAMPPPAPDTLAFALPSAITLALEEAEATQSGASVGSFIRKRFWRADEQVGSQAHRRAAQAQHWKAQWSQRQRVQRSNKVVMFRQYREGELPDVSIAAKDAIKPMIALANLDAVLARSLFSTLFQALYAELNRSVEADQMRENLSESLKKLLSDARGTPAFAGALLTICLDNEGLLVPAPVIASAALRSMNGHVGALLLEKLLTTTEPRPAKRSRTVKSEASTGSDCWVALAEVYNAMHEDDILEGVLKKEGGETIAEILRKDSEQEQLTKCEAVVSVSSENKTMAHALLTQLARRLLKWDVAAATVADQDILNLLAHGHTVDAELLARAWIRNEPAKLTVVADSALSGSDATEQALRFISPEVLLADIARDGIDHASAVLQRAWRSFVTEWSALHPLATASREAALRHARSLAQIDSFLLSATEQRLGNTKPLATLLATWQRGLLSYKRDPVDVWDNARQLRLICLGKLKEMRSAVMDTDESSNVSLGAIEKVRFAVDVPMRVAIAVAARKQKSEVAKDCLIQVATEHRDTDYLVVLMKTYIQGALDTVDTALRASKFDKVLSFIRGKASMFKEHQHVLSGIALQGLGRAKNSSAEFSLSIDEFKKALSMASGTRAEAKAHLRLALVCDELHKRKPTDELAVAFVTHVLKATALGLPKARLYFPRVLDVVTCQSAREAFMREIAHVPCWMALRWVPQLVSQLDKPAGECAVYVLRSLADAYPQALFFPLRTVQGDITNPAYKDLCDRVAMKSLDRFAHAMGLLMPPELFFKDWTKKLIAAINAAALTTGLAAEFIADAVNEDKSYLGSYHKQFIQVVRKDIAAKIGVKGEKAEKSGTGVSQAIHKWRADADTHMKKYLGDKMRLDQFSTWFNEYAALGTRDIELPGQYHGDTQPIVAAHARIVGFEPQVSVMRSLRKPIKITILASDERAHPFLVKAGEDLRLDQRIQQLFGAMNAIFATDAACTQRNLMLRTYQVVPLTKEVGILEWVDNTEPLKSVIMREANRPERNLKNMQETTAGIYDKYIKEASTSDNTTTRYAQVITQYSADKVRKQMEELYQKVPGDLLRSGVLSLAASPEAYIAVRSRFASSLATLSIAGYIVGLGDRHLENFLLDNSTGHVIGIDFGMAFGLATTLLPVVEIIPFRMTRQFTAFFDPLGPAVLKKYMCKSLSALRNAREVLMTVMSVFANEPLVDWAAPAVKKGKGATTTQSTTSPAEEKLNIADLKLRGYSSAHVMTQELKTLLKQKLPMTPAHGHLERLVNSGSTNKSVGAGICATVEQQVDCMFEHATDVNILGRTWQGWMPWI